MSVKRAKEIAAQQLKQLNDGVAAAEAHKKLRDEQLLNKKTDGSLGFASMFSAFSTKVNVGKAQLLASKLGVDLTP